MSIQNSIDFISNMSADNELRSLLNQLPPLEFTSVIKELGYEFSPEEFEESVNLLHFKCQFEEQAEKLFEIVTWYRMLTAIN